MTEELVAGLERIVDGLASGAQNIGSEALANVAEHVAKAFKVQPDEVAILALADQGKFLKFIIPEKLQSVGAIPMNSTSALAVRTAREKRPELINNFTALPHASVFEGVPMARRHGQLIHKIISAPILAADKVVGVVQVSRKGRTAEDSGTDFTQRDLRGLVAIAGVLGRFVKHFQGA